MTQNIETTVKVKVRDSNLELFRIVLMLAIIMHHYVVNSGLYSLLLESRGTFRSDMLLCLGAWGKTGINCFLLITGYFMCKFSITVEKFLKLFCEVIFYLVVCNMIFFLSGYVPFTSKNLLSCLISGDLSHSFSETFLIFFMTIPFLNILINNISEKQYKILLILLFGWYTLLPSLNWRIEITFNYVTWFGVVYLLGGYIRLYPKTFFKNQWLWGVVSLILIIIGCLSVIYYPLIYFWVSDSNKLLAVAASVSLFMFFKNIPIPHTPIINWFAKSIFGVLLIHANSDFMRKWLWEDILKNTSMLSSSYLWFHIAGSVFGIFIICSLLDHLRLQLIEKPFFQKYQTTFSGWNRWFCIKDK